MSEEEQNRSDSEKPERLLSGFSPASIEEWHEEVIRLLKGRSFDRVMTTGTIEGITLDPIYTAENTADIPHISSLPGDPSPLRGSRTSGYLSRTWDVAQELPFPDTGQFNKALLHDLKRGQTAANLLLDRAGRNGTDPDHAAPESVGAGGTSISSLTDLSRALDHVDLNIIPLYMEAGTAAMPAAAILFALAKEKGFDPALMRGCVGTDPIGDLVDGETDSFSIENAYDEAAELARWAVRSAPALRTTVACGFPWHDGGGSAVHELAFTLASAIETVRQMEERGVTISDTAPRMLFRFSIGPSFFMEIAKLRAARLLWARILSECGNGVESSSMRIHTRTSTINKTVFDSPVNILRSTTEAFAAIMGGCDSLHVTPFDECLGLPENLARRLARNTQLILREECRFDRVIDPAGGSWYIESLTDQLARSAWETFRAIEQEGGMITALRNGTPQKMTAAAATERGKRTTTRKEVLVGVHRYPNPEEPPVKMNWPDYPKFRRERAEHIQKERNSRTGFSTVDLSGKQEDRFAQLIAYAGEGATLGEMKEALRPSSREHLSVVPVKPFRIAGRLEKLRSTVLAGRSDRKREPHVFLANLGPWTEYKPRLDFTQSFFHVAGLEVAGDEWFDSPETAAKAAEQSGAPIVVIVSTDGRYAKEGADLATALKRGASPPTVLLAGMPVDLVDSLREAGVEEWIHLRSDADSILTELVEKIGAGR